MAAKLIRINIEELGTRVYTSSPDMKGLVTTGQSRADVLAKLPEVIALTFKAFGDDVRVHEAEMASGMHVSVPLNCSAMFVVVPQNG